jgi:hypothetical protein
VVPKEIISRALSDDQPRKILEGAAPAEKNASVVDDVEVLPRRDLRVVFIDHDLAWHEGLVLDHQSNISADFFEEVWGEVTGTEKLRADHHLGIECLRNQRPKSWRQELGRERE